MIFQIAIPLCVFLIVCAIMPYAIKRAVQSGFVDQPGGRKDHEGNIPPIGGLVLFPVFLLAIPFSIENWGEYVPLIIGIAILLCVGGIDDYGEIKPRYKFGAQFLAAGIIVLFGNARIFHLGDLFGMGDFGLGFVSIPFSIVAAVLLINAINLMDGLDGLAGGIGVVICSLFAFGIVASGHAAGANLQILLLLISALAGFLVYNMRTRYNKKARVFMGDAGSMALGLCIAWFAMKLVQDPHATFEPMSIAWVLALPIMDTCAQFNRRVRNGRHPFSPDRGHFHHHFIEAGYSVSATVSIILFIIAVGGVYGILWVNAGAPVWWLTLDWIGTILLHMYLSYKPQTYVSIFLWLKR